LPDAALKMVICGPTLNAFYSKMIHVICTAHRLHKMAEEERSQYETVDQLISNITKIFRKPSSRLLSKTKLPDLPLPLVPLITEWGTWTNAAVYYCKHLNGINGKNICTMMENV